MRKISLLATILITSFVMTLSGLGASPVATASENESVRVSSRFAFGSSLLSKAQKVEIEKAVTTSGEDATFLVTGVAGKLPGVSDSQVQLLAKKRAQAIKSHLVQLGVNKASVAVQVTITRIGIVPKTRILSSVAAPILTTPITTPTTPDAPWVPIYSVGDTGPGGGLIYYVSTVGFSCGFGFTATGSPTNDLCHYLEVAPNGWDNGGATAPDPAKPWAPGDYTSGNAALDVVDIINDSSTARNNADAIGLGLKNSIAIVTQGNDTTTAAGAARAYTGGSKSDWYLPTTAELNLLCQWGLGVTQAVSTRCEGGSLNTGTGVSGGFVADLYWSSSESDYRQAHRQFFGNGFQSSLWKFNPHKVRPVRAF